MSTHHDELRAWARGLHPLEAATELLIRSGWAEPPTPWVKHDEARNRPWIDFAVIPDEIGALSGGEQRVLRIAASLGADSPIILGDELPGLDREHATLVLAAVAHASGQHEHGKTIELVDDRPQFVTTTPLFTWPA